MTSDIGIIKAARMTRVERTIGSEPKRDSKIQVETPTHLAAVLDFASGPIVMPAGTANLEVYGSEGALMPPDPNTFGGLIRLKKLSSRGWEGVTIARPYATNLRGIGLTGMANTIRTDRFARAAHSNTIRSKSSELGTQVSASSQLKRPPVRPHALPNVHSESIF